MSYGATNASRSLWQTITFCMPTTLAPRMMMVCGWWHHHKMKTQRLLILNGILNALCVAHCALLGCQSFSPAPSSHALMLLHCTAALMKRTVMTLPEQQSFYLCRFHVPPNVFLLLLQRTVQHIRGGGGFHVFS